jgi:formate dehydrogenase major subunit
MITVKIDDKTIEVPEGTTVLRAAEKAGSFIPTLCDHPELTPYGGCRLCLVEVEGARTLQPSCTLPVSPNMVVHTDTEKIRDARKFVLTLLFSERNHFCMYCQVSGGDCDLQNAAYREGMTHWSLQPNWQPYAVDASHPFFVLDNNRCILCRRCVRACGELVGNFTLGFEERGARSFLVADLGTPLAESTCVSCGVCLQVCPTGALIDRQSAYRGKETQVEHHITVCVGCSVGCGVDVLTRDNRLVRIEGNWDAPVSRGVLCKTGRFSPQEEDRERILTPLVRKDGSLKAATWDEALSVISSRFQNGSQVAALASSRLTVEALSAFKQIFTDCLHSDMVASLEEGSSAAAASVAAEMGKPFETKLEALNTADAVLTLDLDLMKEHEVAGFFVKRTLPIGTKLVVVDKGENDLDRWATHPVKPTKGTDLDVVQGLIAAKSGADLQAYCEKTGISAATFTEVAEILSGAENAVLLYGKGIESAALKALLDLAAATGAKVLGMKGAANSLASTLLGFEKPFQMNGHQAVYVALGDDKPSQRLVQKLESAPFLAVQASYASQLTAQADVVLPVEMWAEQEGHFVTLDGRVQKAEKALAAADEVRSNTAALEALAAQLGAAFNQDWHAQLNQKVSAVAVEG